MTASGGCSDDTEVIRPLEEDQKRQALAMLLTGRPSTLPEVVDEFLGLVGKQQLSLDDLWAAYQRGQPVGATLILPGAGRTATCLVCPVLERSRVAAVGRLVQTACSSQDSSKTRIIQAMVEPGNSLEVQAFRAAGFGDVACLEYMELRTPTVAMPEAFGDSIQVLNWTQQRRPLFAQAILDSYEGTKDCPGLVGLRNIDDIIASHMATGVFSPRLWFCLVVADQPIAVMLLNHLPQRHAMELVYLGVRLNWRQRGVGRRLIDFGSAQCRQHGVSKMVLAVDQSNTPAKTLYQRLGFVTGGRKLALIFTLT